MENIVKDLISFKTVEGNLDEFQKCFDYIADYMSGTDKNIKMYEYKGYKSCVISNTSSKEFDILFVGHIDVVPAMDSMFVSKTVDNILYGRGSFDMKGNDAAIFKFIKNVNTDKKIGVFITSDEELGGFNGTKYLLENEKYTTKVAIVPDGDKNFNLVTEGKGVLQLKIVSHGVSAHSSLLWEGENAILKLFNVYNELVKKYCKNAETDFATTINLSKIQGGDAINKVPDTAHMYLDIRNIYSDKKEGIIDYIKSIDSNVEIEVIAEGEYFNLDIENEYVKKYIASAEKILNRKVDFIQCNSSNDARFFCKYGIPAIIMNPEGDNYHKDDEYVKLGSLDTLYDIYCEFTDKF
ncbi:MAG TPA: hypothetical protein DEP72_03595 [Clostridiales bacterium]|nr:MAG: hypothetical protein A2Y18_00765 [Clostridiales bacterium GWD2_32_19]HCC07237.1 hypothetical protein [Clostridiales bacterium]